MHLHSNHSDGSDAPARVVDRAAEKGIAAIALTDHDTVSGVAEAQAVAQEKNIGFLPGVEISAGLRRREIHITGLGVNTECPALLAALHRTVEGRLNRAHEIIKKLKALGIPISEEAVLRRCGGKAVGRMHIAQEIHALGHASTIQGAFDKYIGSGKKAFVRKQTVPIEEAVDLIHEAGGLAFIAHPGIGRLRDDLPRLLQLPFDGIEAYHSKHSPGEAEAFTILARERGLLIAGGSDCHGTAKNAPDMGKVQVPYAVYESICEKLDRC